MTEKRRSLLLEDRAFARRQGGVVGDVPRSHIVWNTGDGYRLVTDGRNDPLWPDCGHSPLSGGE